MAKERVLVIPGAFVPFHDTVTLLTYKHLRNIDAEFDVVALRGPEDPDLKRRVENDPAFKNFHIEYVCDYNQAVATYEKKNVLSGVYWFHRYCRAALKKAESYPYKVVYTSSVPAFSHLAGYWIKKKFGSRITWVASMSDPLFRSPYKHDHETIREYNLIQKVGFYIYITIFMDSRHEKLAQRYADKMVYICEEQRDFSISQYSCSKDCYQKSMIVPLNYITEWSGEMMKSGALIPAQHSPKIFSHLGRIYSLRKIDEFLEALNQLKSADPMLADKIQFAQYGQITERYQKYIADHHLEDVFQIKGKVPYAVAEQKMIESDGLVLFDTIMPEDEIQPYLPSKAIEYMILRKDLLVITTSRSPSWRIFTSFGYHCCHNDAAEIKQEICNLIVSKTQRHEYDISMYENTRATAELTAYIQDCLSGRRRGQQ